MSKVARDEGDVTAIPRFNEGRLGTAPTPLFASVVNAPGVLQLRDPERLRADLTVDLAHTVMLSEQRVIPRAVAAKICGALLRALELGPDAIALDTSRDGTLFQIESYLASQVGREVAGQMHTGRSRTDRDATIMRFHVRAHLLDVIDALIVWQRVLVDQAAAHVDTVMPGYTHLQPAQPITLGHHLTRTLSVMGTPRQRSVV
ncbi:MAG: hypothetical protein HY615_15850 [Candidatus Rokubacteria bacterium]|nr:hypothetical protein [Candidatus Rokubacteria bacterium]